MTDNTNRQTIEDSQPQVPVITNPAALQPQISVVTNSTTFQVMSPETDKHTFISLLDGPETFNDWSEEFDSVVQLYYPALEAYLVDENNSVFDKNLNVLQNEHHIRIMLGNYKAIINGLLSRSLTKSTFTKLKIAISKFKKEQHYAKLVFNYIKTQFGKITFKQLVKVFYDYNSLDTSDGVELANHWNNVKDLLSNPMYSLYLLFSKCPKGVQEKLLDVFGLLTTLDEDAFRNLAIDLCEEYTNKSKAFKTKLIKSKRPSCPICKGNHWKRDCPKYKFKNKGRKTGYVTANDEVESDSEIHEDHFANVCIKDDHSNTGPECFLATFLAKEKKPDKENDIWYIDSGATDHMISDLDSFIDISRKKGSNVKGIGGTIPIEGKGTARKHGYTIKNASYAPKMPCNLLSVSRMVAHSGYSFLFTEDAVYAVKLKREMLEDAYRIGTKHKGLYKLLPRSTSNALCGWKIDMGPNYSFLNNKNDMHAMHQNNQAISTNADLWHARLGHCGINAYNSLVKTSGLPPPSPNPISKLCPTCVTSKAIIKKGPISDRSLTAPLQLVEVDLCGSFRYQDFVDSKYFLTIIDVFSRFYFAIPLKSKSEAALALKNWILQQENYFSSRGGYKVCAIRTDNGGEFCNKELREFFHSKGIQHQLTTPHQSWQNGGVERAHRSIQEKIRALLIGGRVPLFLWSEALKCAVYLLNRTPSVGRKNKIPYNKYYGIKENSIKLDHLRVFGCAAYATLPVANRDGKLMPNATQCVMIGYDLDHKAYRLYHPSSNKIFVATNVVFDETMFPFSNMHMNDVTNGKNSGSNSTRATTTRDISPSTPNEFVESDNTFSSSFSGELNLPINTTTSGVSSFMHDPSRESQPTDSTNTPLKQTNSPISSGEIELSTISSAHPPQTDYVPSSRCNNNIERSPIQTRSKTTSTAPTQHRTTNLVSPNSPPRATSTLLDSNSSISSHNTSPTSNTTALNDNTPPHIAKEKELEFREQQLRLAQAEHNHRQQLLEYQTRLHELQLAVQRAQHELELHQQTTAALDSISHQRLNLHQEANTALDSISQQRLNLHQEANAALDTVYNERLASKKHEIQALGDIHQKSISLNEPFPNTTITNSHTQDTRPTYSSDFAGPSSSSNIQKDANGIVATNIQPSTPSNILVEPFIETPGSTSQSALTPVPATRSILLPLPQQPALLPASSSSPTTQSSSEDVIFLRPPNTSLKRSHSEVTPSSPPPTSPIDSTSGALIPVTHPVSTLIKSPPSKRHHQDHEHGNATNPHEDATGLLGSINLISPFSVGNTPVPIYGVDNAIVPYGDSTNHHCFLVKNSANNSTEISVNPVTTALMTQAVSKTFPKTIKQAAKSPDKKKWMEACKREYDALVTTNTFEQVKLPSDRKAIPTRWVFTVKDNGLYKARIVVQGFRQKEGIDYDATFAPVVRYESVRFFLALSAKHNMVIHQMDVVTAFLNSKIDRNLYVKPPPGYELPDGKVWKLKSALYGLKQSPLLWNEHIKKTLGEIQFQQHPAEFGIYYRKRGDNLCLIALYVDDLLISSVSLKEINDIKTFLSKKYKMKDLGKVNKFLGMNITQSRGEIKLSLEDYITKKVKELQIQPYPTHTPLQPSVNYYGDSPKLENVTSFQSLIGILLFVSNTGRPDIAQSVSMLSRFLKDPREIHMKAAKRVLAYLFTTKTKSLTYKNDKKDYFEIFTDASYADCPDAKSTFGYIIKFASAPISWCSRKIPCLVTSSTEAEYVAASETLKECIWLDEILKILEIKSSRHRLHIDNESAIKLADHPIFHSKTKHIRVRYHFARELVKSGLIEVHHIGTKDQIADICTKVLPRKQFEYLRDLIFNINDYNNN